MRGDRLRELRESRGESQRALAAAVGCSSAAIAQYESGTRSPDALILLRIAAHYGVSSEYLLGLTDDPRRQKDLPPGWEQVLAEAARYHMSPEDVANLIRQVGEFISRRKGED